VPSISHAPESPQVPRLAAIYARVSTTDQADKGYSLPKQIDACLAYAQAQGYRVEDHRIFTDDFTGVSLNRPALQQLRALMHTGAIHALICFEQDRLSRKLAHQLMLADEAEECGVTVHFTAVPASERTPETQLFTNITGAFHEYDRLRILKRTRDGLVGRAKAGYAPGGRPPLGYRYVKHPQKGGYYEVHAREAALVREIFALYTTDGLSIGDIARRLTVERVPTCQDSSTQEAR